MPNPATPTNAGYDLPTFFPILSRSADYSRGVEKSLRQQAALAGIFLAVGLVTLSIIVSLTIFIIRRHRQRRTSVAHHLDRSQSPPSFIDYATKRMDTDTTGNMMRSTAEHDYLHYDFDWDLHKVVIPLLDVPMPTTVDQHNYGNEDNSPQSNFGNSGLIGADHLHQAVNPMTSPSHFPNWRFSETPSSPSVYPDTLIEDEGVATAAENYDGVQIAGNAVKLDLNAEIWIPTANISHTSSLPPLRPPRSLLRKGSKSSP